jgi:hypothetical protein
VGRTRTTVAVAIEALNQATATSSSADRTLQIIESSNGREHAIRLLDELSAGQRPRWTLVDANARGRRQPRQRNRLLSRKKLEAL